MNKKEEAKWFLLAFPDSPWPCYVCLVSRDGEGGIPLFTMLEKADRFLALLQAPAVVREVSAPAVVREVSLPTLQELLRRWLLNGTAQVVCVDPESMEASSSDILRFLAEID